MLDTTATSQQFQQAGWRDDSSGSWPLSFDATLALHALRQAPQRARRLAHPLIVSITQPVPWRDPLAIYAAMQALGAKTDFYWEQPAQRRALVGSGSAATMTTGDNTSIGATSDTPIQQAAARWRDLLADAQIIHAPASPADASDSADTVADSLSGPLYFGGFAFDPLAPRTSLWEGFPTGLLTLPRLLFGAVNERLTLTTNYVVHGGEDDNSLQRLVERQARAVMRLCASVEQGAEVALAAPGKARLSELRSAEEWQAAVAQATSAIRRGDYVKVVLARGVQAQAERPFAIPATLARLRAGYPSACVFALRRGSQTFLGATPERLARVADGRVETMALAGTAPRGTTEDADVALGHELQASAKNRGEHAIVATTIREALTPLVCDPHELHSAKDPQLLRLSNVQHLMTPISAALRPDMGALDVVAALHPTPAVGGYPREAALAAIRASEGLDRGWYAGPVGWVGPSGEGAFAVALRSALVDGARATLFAGCGIVADSDPEAEYAESQLKLRVMLRGLGLDVAQTGVAQAAEENADVGAEQCADDEQPHDA